MYLTVCMTCQACTAAYILQSSQPQSCMVCSEDEALADMNAFNREYENDNSWEQLQEDEYGHLRPLVSPRTPS